MNDKRSHHACMYDAITSSIHVMGGLGRDLGFGNNMDLATTEKWIVGSDTWLVSSNLPESIGRTSAVSAKSNNYVGYIAGGRGFATRELYSNKIWGLRRIDKTWITMNKTLEIGRSDHSLLNISPTQIFEC